VSWVWIGQLSYGLLVILGVIYAIIQIFHTLTFPLSEEKTREIIREEMKKILVEEKKS